MSIRWSGWIWANGTWRKVCAKGDFTLCIQELYEQAKAAGIKDPTRLAMSLGNVPPWTPQAAGDKAADTPGEAEDPDTAPQPLAEEH
jgi:hypothetical protein